MALSYDSSSPGKAQAESLVLILIFCPQYIKTNLKIFKKRLFRCIVLCYNVLTIKKFFAAQFGAINMVT